MDGTTTPSMTSFVSCALHDAALTSNAFDVGCRDLFGVHRAYGAPSLDTSRGGGCRSYRSCRELGAEAATRS